MDSLPESTPFEGLSPELILVCLKKAAKLYREQEERVKEPLAQRRKELKEKYGKMLLEKMPKQILVLAGHNGAGKTTPAKILMAKLGIAPEDFIDTDEETLRRRGVYNFEAFKATQREIDAEKEQLIASGKPCFGFETILGSKRHLGFLRRAKEKGYRVMLVYVMLDSRVRAIDKVEKRILDGGKNRVEPENIAAIFSLSKEHAVEVAALADQFYVYENSCSQELPEPVHCLSGKLGAITYKNPAMPVHVRLLAEALENPKLPKERLHSLDKPLEARAMKELWGE